MEKFLCILLLLMSIPQVAFSETTITVTTIEGVDLRLKLSGTSATVETSAISRDVVGQITIPTSVVFNEQNYQVEAIGYQAFYLCNGLVSISIPKSVSAIGESAFMGCSALRSVNIPEGVSSIEKYTFSGCKSLETLEIPGSVTMIKDYAFNDSHIKKLILKEGENNLWCGLSGTSYYIQNGEKIYSYYGLFQDKYSEKAIVDTVYLGRNFFERMTDTQKYPLPFKGCLSLKCLEISESLSSIANNSFSGCSNLSTIISYQKEPFNIRYTVFSGISSDYKFYIPYGTRAVYNTTNSWITNDHIVAMIEKGIFFVDDVSYGNNIINATFKVTNENPLQAEMGGKEEAALNAETSDELILPLSVTGEENDTYRVVGLGKYACANTNLLRISIPLGYEYIQAFAFDQCQNLKKVTIPKSVTRIENAFTNCNNIDTVYVFWRDLNKIEIASDNFNMLSPNAVLMIPSGTRGQYATHEVWGRFSQIIECSPISLGDITTQNGSTAYLPINLNNTETILGVQFKLTLPKDVAVEENEGGLVASTTERSSDWIIMGRKDPDSDNNYLFVAFSLQGHTLIGNEGAIMNIKLNIANTMELGTFEMDIKDICVTTTTYVSLYLQDSSSDLTISDFTPGDANGDGNVDLTDAIMIVYSSLGVEQSGLIEKAADVNGDKEIDLTDAIIVVYKSLGINRNQVKAREVEPE